MDWSVSGLKIELCSYSARVPKKKWKRWYSRKPCKYDGRNDIRPRKMTRLEAKAGAKQREMKEEMKWVMKAEMTFCISWMDMRQEKMEATVHALRTC